MSVINKYHKVDKKMSKEVHKELIEKGVTSYPTTCRLCRGKGCNSCNNGEVEISIL